MDEREKDSGLNQPDDLNLPDQQPSQAPDEYDEKGRRIYNEYGEKIHWASPRDRVVALILALVVIIITIAMAYSISVGDFFRW